MSLKVYVKLLDEGVDVWRPMPANATKSPESFTLGTPPDYRPESENLEFLPGEEVRCERRNLENQEEWIAIEVVGETDRQKLARFLKNYFPNEFEISDASPLSWQIVHRKSKKTMTVKASKMMGRNWTDFLKGEVSQFLKSC